MMSKLTWCLMFAAAFAATGCGDDGGVAPAEGDAMPMLPADDCTSGESHFYVVSVLDIAGEADGVSEGFNLDGRISDTSDDQGCNKNDFTSPSGEEGVDNALAVLLPILEMFAGDLSATLQENINDGSILLLAEMTSVDDFTNDACVGMNLYIGEVPGDVAPMLSSDRLSPGQTFDINPESLDAKGEPIVSVTGASFVGGNLNAATDVISLPVPLEEGTVLELNIRNARVGGQFTADTMSNGIIAGVLSIDELSESVAALDLGVGAETIAPILMGQADILNDSGECSSLSATLTYQGVDAVRGDVRSADGAM